VGCPWNAIPRSLQACAVNFWVCDRSMNKSTWNGSTFFDCVSAFIWEILLKCHNSHSSLMPYEMKQVCLLSVNNYGHLNCGIMYLCGRISTCVVFSLCFIPRILRAWATSEVNFIAISQKLQAIFLETNYFFGSVSTSIEFFSLTL